MTYCVAMRLNAGLVFLSDSRTNAGVDQISTFRKMMIYEKPGERFMVLLSAGNLSISQSVREILQVEKIDNGNEPPITIWNATSMFDAARVLGMPIDQATMVTSEPARAIRARRSPLMIAGVRRSLGVIEPMIASMRSSTLSSMPDCCIAALALPTPK